LFFFFYDLGNAWEKIGKKLELLVMEMKELQIYLGTTWE